MLQNGSDDEGILGFLSEDILKIRNKRKSTRCSYCLKFGATVQCGKRCCKVIFHLPCGIKHNALPKFTQTFRTYCCNHRDVQVVPQESYSAARVTAPTCVICISEVDIEDKFNSLWAPCCNKSWYHRKCVGDLALSLGSLFRCPTCSNRRIFNREMVKLGIYIPKRDASWEREPNAFHELLVRHSQCDTIKCFSPKGRQYDGKDSRPWTLLICCHCGSSGTHRKCMNLKNYCSKWICHLCTFVQWKLAVPGLKTAKVVLKRLTDSEISKHLSGDSLTDFERSRRKRKRLSEKESSLHKIKRHIRRKKRAFYDEENWQT